MVSSKGNATFDQSLNLQAGLFSASLSYALESSNASLSNFSLAYAMDDFSVCSSASDFFGDTGAVAFAVDGDLCGEVRSTRGLVITAILLLPLALFFRLRRRQHKIGAGIYALSGE